MIEKKQHLVTSGSVCLDPSGQQRPTKESKVQIAMYRVALWRLGPTGQQCSMRKVQSPNSYV